MSTGPYRPLYQSQHCMVPALHSAYKMKYMHTLCTPDFGTNDSL